MSKEKYSIILTGQGDTDIMLVDKEIFDWVLSPYPLESGSGVDPTVPESVKERIDDEVYIGCRSFENDRCLFIGDASERQFFSMMDFLSYVRDNDIKIVDSYEGYIY